MDDSSGTEEAQYRLSRYENEYGFDTTKLVERIRDANDRMLDVPKASDWLDAHRSLARLRLERRMRGAWEASGMDDEFSYLQQCMDRRERQKTADEAASKNEETAS